MRPFSKTNRLSAEIDELAAAIYHVAITSSETYEDVLKTIDEHVPEIDRDVAITELISLRQFVAVYASQTYLRGDEVKQRAREVHIGIVHKALKEATDPRIRADPNVAIDMMNRRLVLYWDAMPEAENANPLWNIGKVFCQLCTGNPTEDLDVIMLGSVEFVASLRAVTDFLRERKKTDASDLIDI